MDPFEQLVEALNRLADEASVVALSITFSRSDVPVDWDFETRKWEVLTCTDSTDSPTPAEK